MLRNHPNVTWLSTGMVDRLETDASGRSIKAVSVTRIGQQERYSGDIVVAICGALGTALLLLGSANDARPNGHANGSERIGRDYMRRNQPVLMALSHEPNEATFQENAGRA